MNVFRKIGFAMFLGLVLAIFVVTTNGCAETTFSGICGLKPIGADEQGIHYFMTYCEAK